MNYSALPGVCLWLIKHRLDISQIITKACLGYKLPLNGISWSGKTQFTVWCRDVTHCMILNPAVLTSHYDLYWYCLRIYPCPMCAVLMAEVHFFIERWELTSHSKRSELRYKSSNHQISLQSAPVVWRLLPHKKKGLPTRRQAHFWHLVESIVLPIK